MKVLKQKLQRHSCTRQWVGLGKQAVPEDEQELLGVARSSIIRPLDAFGPLHAITMTIMAVRKDILLFL